MTRKKDYTIVPEGLELQALKRAEFKCEHCHKSVPRVFLNVGWLNTAAELPDEDDIDKVYCLCESCCRKQKHKLQYRPVSSAADRHSQLQQLIAWHREEDNLEQFAFDIILDVLREKIKPAYLYKAEKTRLKEYLKTYDILDILKAIDISVGKYARFDGDDCLQESIPGVVEKLGGILYNQTLSPVDSECSHVRHICKNNFGSDDYNDREAKAILHDYVTHLRSQDMTDEDIIEELKDKPKRLAGSCGTFAQWCKSMRELLPKEEDPEFEDLIPMSSRVIPSSLSAMNDHDELYPGEHDLEHNGQWMMIHFANIRICTIKYLLINSGFFTLAKWDAVKDFFEKGLRGFFEERLDDILNGYRSPLDAGDLGRQHMDSGELVSIMRGPFEWKTGGNPEMPAKVKGFIIGDMMQGLIDEISGFFYSTRNYDEEDYAKELEFYLDHIDDILNTSDVRPAAVPSAMNFGDWDGEF